MEILIFLAAMIGLMWFISNRGKKQQAAARERLEDGLVPGTWVMTIGGFFGKVVEIDGDVVTLESPSGVETIWIKNAIKEVKEPPFAGADDEDEPESVSAEGVAEIVDGPDEPQDPTMRPGGPTVTDDGRLSDDDKRS